MAMAEEEDATRSWLILEIRRRRQKVKGEDEDAFEEKERRLYVSRDLQREQYLYSLYAALFITPPTAS